MSYKPRLTVYPTIRIRNVCAIFRMHVVQIQHRFYKFSTNFKVTRKFLQNKKTAFIGIGSFFIFPQDAKKRNMTAFARALTLRHGIRRRNVPVEKAARLSSSISPACRNAPSMMPPPCSESDSTPKVSAKVCIAERRSSPFVPANK